LSFVQAGPGSKVQGDMHRRMIRYWILAFL
jgi:hypothetical protein